MNWKVVMQIRHTHYFCRAHTLLCYLRSGKIKCIDLVSCGIEQQTLTPSGSNMAAHILPRGNCANG
jgi:hypothetical protein